MNSTKLGDLLEGRIYEIFRSIIEEDQFWARKNCCKIFRRKGYYSKDRCANIVFDVSIEIYLPGATKYSSIVFIECKNYTHSVPVDDAEEFFTKVQQISGANVKAVIASTAAFSRGTRKFSESKGIGLVRYFDPSELKWELMRSPSTTAYYKSNTDTEVLVDKGLSEENFESTFFDFYFQSVKRNTNSLCDFMEDFALESDMTPEQLRKIKNPRIDFSSQVPFIEKEDLEEKSVLALIDIEYKGGEVSLSEICAREQKRCGLKVTTEVALPLMHADNPILGRIDFRSLEIHIFKQESSNKGRERFTLAHELSHHLLGHASYMVQEYCDEEDHALSRVELYSNTDILRMEYQANYLAACLLMPKTQFTEDFRRVAEALDIANKGFGALFVDNQVCNIQSYMQLTNLIMQKYGVSRQAASIRLDSLGFLRDIRAQSKSNNIFKKLLNSAYFDQ